MRKELSMSKSIVCSVYECSEMCLVMEFVISSLLMSFESCITSYCLSIANTYDQKERGYQGLDCFAAPDWTNTECSERI